ncbi:MAG TPA: glycosyltransferase 87 family protein, partial [Polyangia bacterium]|nr:glycosyltransferase 87 family protein [Polyangia bacterium]
MRRSPTALAAIAVVALAGAWFAARALQQDFAAYFIAGAARARGLDPYVNHVGAAGPGVDGRLWDGVATFRHSRFLYPPLVADLFRPLAALPYLAAKSLFTAAMLGAWLGAGLLAAGDRRGRTAYFVASALFFPLYRHLERGQLDL